MTPPAAGDGQINLTGQLVFSVSRPDDPLTPIDETPHCLLSSIIRDIDEEETTSQAKARIFVGRTASASVKNGRIIK